MTKTWKKNCSKNKGVSFDIPTVVGLLKHAESAAKRDDFNDSLGTSDSDADKNVNEICETLSNLRGNDSDVTEATTADDCKNDTEGIEDLKFENIDREEDEFSHLIEASKTCLKYNENLAILQENIVTLDDLEIAHSYLDRIFDSKGFVINSEIHLILGIFFFRSAQVCAQNKLVATCKLSLNLELAHSEFSKATARENNAKDIMT